MSIESITVPDLGDATEVEVIELLVSVGQNVEENDSLLVLESEKAAMEIPAPVAGTVKSIAVNLGDQVKTGSAMMTLEVAVGAEITEEVSGKEVDENTEISASSATSTQAQAEPTNSDIQTSEAVLSPAESAEVSITVSVPDLGTEDEVEVIELHVKQGDEIAVDESIVTLESDKAAMEVPSPNKGVIESVLISIGDKVKSGSPILQMLGSVNSASEPSVAVAEKADSKTTNTQNESTPIEKSQVKEVSAPAILPGINIYAGPAVRKLARELGADLHQVLGTGEKSRITKEDLHEFVKKRINSTGADQGATMASVSDIDFSQFGEIEQVSRSKLHKLTAANMHRNWNVIPHVAQFNEADITNLEDFRGGLKTEAERRGIKLTFMPFLLKACASALQEFPQFNVSLHSSGEYVIQKKYIHIGVAVATEAGLVVPVVRNVDQKNIWQLAEEVIQFSDKAKQRKLSIEDMQGACFSISSLGAIGGTGFIPIVNAPEVAILGVAKTDIKPVYIDGEFVPRKMLPLTLSYDHKAVNGVDGGLFATHLAKLLSDIRYLSF
ncbi:MAG TPA: dihydrolipoyllysine-residue acetyltransferase [Porticoccaceae bacterium]|nr:dihydrolipoyllysine-residue acetyltransferase [Gammaproteobacteria bacterium]HIL59110.1 dihydrolipoyllysine-residue acetyltransferase [Porticoccaceae bacterium]